MTGGWFLTLFYLHYTDIWHDMIWSSLMQTWTFSIEHHILQSFTGANIKHMLHQQVLWDVAFGILGRGAMKASSGSKSLRDRRGPPLPGEFSNTQVAGHGESMPHQQYVNLQHMPYIYQMYAYYMRIILSYIHVRLEFLRNVEKRKDNMFGTHLGMRILNHCGFGVWIRNGHNILQFAVSSVSVTFCDMKYQHDRSTCEAKNAANQTWTFKADIHLLSSVDIGNGTATYHHLTLACDLVNVVKECQGIYYTPYTPPLNLSDYLQCTCEHWQHVKCWNEGTGRWAQEHHFFTWTSCFHSFLGDSTCWRACKMAECQCQLQPRRQQALLQVWCRSSLKSQIGNSKWAL